MGKFYLDSKVRVLAPSPSGYQELISFDAHADSGEMPEAAVMGPAGAAAVIETNAVAGELKSYKNGFRPAGKEDCRPTDNVFY
jgi:hypothetical protein